MLDLRLYDDVKAFWIFTDHFILIGILLCRWEFLCSESKKRNHFYQQLEIYKDES